MHIHLSITAPTDPPSTFEHNGPVIVIGRDPECDLVLQGEAGSATSRRHAQVELSEAGAIVTDLGSSNGTLLNGQMLDGPAPLRLGDRIQMGYTGPTLTVLKLQLTAAAAVATEKPARRIPPALLIGSAAAAALVVAIVIAVLVLRKPGGPEYVVGPSTEAPGASASSERAGPSIAAVSPVDTGKVVPDSRLIGDKPTKPSPELETKEIGAYVALDKWVSVLLRRQGEDQPWGVLPPEARVATAQTLVSLPGYRSLLLLDGGMQLTLWGNLPEFSPFPPVLESVVMLHAPASGIDLDFTLDRGRVLVANRKTPAGPARVRMHFLQQVWELELPDDKDNSEAVVELWGQPQTTTAGGPVVTTTCLGLFTKGRVRVKTPRQTLDLGPHSRIGWESIEPDKPEQASLPEVPAWWDKPPDRNLPEVQKAMLSLLEWRDRLGGPRKEPDKASSPKIEAKALLPMLKTKVQEDAKDPDNQDVGVLFLASLDVVEPLVALLEDRQNSSNVRGVTLFALQSWLNRGGQHAAELARILSASGHKGDLIVRLLHFYDEQDLVKRTTYELLVSQLDDEDPLVRELSIWQLDQIGRSGRLPEEAKSIAYDPTWDAGPRRAAVEKWKRLLAEGKVPRR
jgi:pSer/pThr/pTyr-binding forkhead associated (FHA) protein